MTHTTEQERAEFEKHILAPNGFFDKGRGWVDRNPDGSYKLTRIQERWLTWQALAAVPQPPACNQSMQPELATYSAQTRNKKGIEQ